MSTPDGPAVASRDERATLRADAERNRSRILRAASEVFSTEGLDGSIAEVARRAGVGIATLYRRFPTREDLVEAVFAEKIASCLAQVESALADPDSVSALRSYLETLCEMQRSDQGFSGVMTTSGMRAGDVQHDHAEAWQGLVQLVDRANSTGRMRPGFRAEDVTMLLEGNAGVIASNPANTEASRRFVAYMLDAFGTAPAAS